MSRRRYPPGVVVWGLSGQGGARRCAFAPYGCYAATRGEVTQVLETLLRTKELVVAQAETVSKAVRLFKEGKADFADCLVERCGSDAGCSATLTFDVGAAKHCGMRVID